jgi:hypothetical protein
MPWTNASIVLNSRDATGGVKVNGNLYSSLLFNAQNQNIIQGQVESISVSEVNFPYDIPNIQPGFNTFGVEFASEPPSENALEVTVPPGFYTGVELETAVNGAIATANQNLETPFADNLLPIVSYDPTANTFTFAQGPGVGSSCLIFSPYTFWNTPPSFNTRNLLGKDIMTIMGYNQNQGAGYATNASYSPLVVGEARSGSAPLVFTQYIDICSPQLCKFQYFRDGSTTNLARRSDVICRLYISNNQATQEEEGQRPFVINRQFQNARVMRWTADNAVGTLDINLYDDTGQPLSTMWLPRPYQITFNCYESPKEEMK